MHFKIGTRRSPLALAQTQYIMELVQLHHPEVEFSVHTISTIADKDRVSEFHQFGIIGVFSIEHEEQLYSREVDLVVHSLKDLPTVQRDGLVLAAVPERRDPRDALCGSAFVDLPHGARIGTGSLRRKSQMLSLRPDVQIVPIRGNVGPRLKKCKGEDALDAVILAQAGLDRLDLSKAATEIFDPDLFPYAVGQGALGVQARADDTRLLEILRSIEHAPSRREVDAERAMLHDLGAGCSLPVGVCSRWDSEGDRLTLQGQITSLNGVERIISVAENSGSNAVELGLATADSLKQKGGMQILESSYREFCAHFKLHNNS